MPTEEEFAQAAEALRGGGLVGMPTETVYGLAANALDEKAVDRVYAVKGRPATSPLIVHVATVEMARALASDWPAAAEVLAARFWPGPLTLVVKKVPAIPDNVTAGLDTVGLRMPAHPVALELIRRAGVPLAGPSANKFTQVSPTTAEHVRESLGDAVELILDGGPCVVGIESTVLSLATAQPTLLRPGMISREELEAALGTPIAVAGAVDGAHPSPGMHHKHYSPRTRVVMVSAEEFPPGRGVYVWREKPRSAEVAIQMPADPVAYARELYGALHRADEAHLDWIAIETPPRDAAWAAIHDRLSRASS